MLKLASFTDTEFKFTNVREGVFLRGEPCRIVLLKAAVSSLGSLGSFHPFWLDPVQGMAAPGSCSLQA